MALACFSGFYKTPAEIVRMADDLSVFPAWYSDRCSAIKVDSSSKVEWLLGQDAVGEWLSGTEWTTEFLSCPYEVWGWNPALLHRLRAAGVDERFLLSDEAVRRIRILSGRQCCRMLLDGFSDLDFTCGESFVCATLDEVRRKLSACGRVVLKAPWSGSGRGLLMTDEAHWDRSAEGWIARILRTQKEIVVEPYYHRVVDFAMEFYCDEKNEVKFAGYSLFETDSRGNYKGNLLASDRQIEQILSSYVSTDGLHAVRERLTSRLSALFDGNYRGYLGIDMMICREGDAFLLHPCVEMNLRMNMGVAAHIIAERYLTPETKGRFVVEHYGNDGEALEAHREMKEVFPLRMSGNFVTSGYLSLTPVFDDTRYQVYVLAECR